MCSRLVSSSSGVSSSRTGTQAQIQVAKKRDRVKTRSRFLINFSKVRLVQSNRLIVSDSGAFCPRRITLSSLRRPACRTRSEEHTSELQSRPHLVCRLLLEKKKMNDKAYSPTTDKATLQHPARATPEV